MCDIMSFVENFNYSRKKISSLVASEAILMSGNERKDKINECNRLIAEFRKVGDEFIRSMGDIPFADYPASAVEKIAAASNRVGRIQCVRKALSFPQAF